MPRPGCWPLRPSRSQRETTRLLLDRHDRRETASGTGRHSGSHFLFARSVSARAWSRIRSPPTDPICSAATWKETNRVDVVVGLLCRVVAGPQESGGTTDRLTREGIDQEQRACRRLDLAFRPIAIRLRIFLVRPLTSRALRFVEEVVGGEEAGHAALPGPIAPRGKGRPFRRDHCRHRFRPVSVLKSVWSPLPSHRGQFQLLTTTLRSWVLLPARIVLVERRSGGVYLKDPVEIAHEPLPQSSMGMSAMAMLSPRLLSAQRMSAQLPLWSRFMPVSRLEPGRDCCCRSTRRVTVEFVGHPGGRPTDRIAFLVGAVELAGNDDPHHASSCSAA